MPVLRCLRRHFPAGEIYWWIDAGLAPLLQEDPDLTGLIPFPRKRWSSPWRWSEIATCLRRLRRLRFDWVIDLQSLARSGLFAWLTNGRLTVGLDDPREGAPAFYDIRVPRPTPHTHAVDWYLSVLPRLGVPQHWDFCWLPQRPRAAARLDDKWPVDGRRWIILKPGARWANKRWPLEHFTELVQSFPRAHAEAHFAVLGDMADQELGRAIAGANPEHCLDLTGQTSLAEMVEWIRRGELMVSNDTGPLHVAAALGKPVVALYGPTDPRRTGPYGQPHRVLRQQLPCAPCMKDACTWPHPVECLRSIPPATVAGWIEEHWVS